MLRNCWEATPSTCSPCEQIIPLTNTNEHLIIFLGSLRCQRLDSLVHLHSSLYGWSTERLEGLEDGEIPIEPAQQIYNNIEVESGDRKRRRLKRAILWRQLPVGQIIAFVMVDITKPPTGKLSLFDLYVALSRSSGQKSIQILRDFHEEISVVESLL